MTPVPLQAELEAFRRALPDLMDRAGKYALVNGSQVVSTWDTYDDAIQEGYREFGLTPFLVKRIDVAEPVYYFTRAVRPLPCPS